METRVFESIDKAHIIKVIIMPKINYFEFVHVNFDYPKTFIDLFVEVVQYLHSHKNPIKHKILEEDLPLFKYSVISNNMQDGTLYIETPHELFLKEIIQVFGLENVDI